MVDSGRLHTITFLGEKSPEPFSYSSSHLPIIISFNSNCQYYNLHESKTWKLKTKGVSTYKSAVTISLKKNIKILCSWASLSPRLNYYVISRCVHNWTLLGRYLPKNWTICLTFPESSLMLDFMLIYVVFPQ